METRTEADSVKVGCKVADNGQAPGSGRPSRLGCRLSLQRHLQGLGAKGDSEAGSDKATLSREIGHGTWQDQCAAPVPDQRLGLGRPTVCRGLGNEREGSCHPKAMPPSCWGTQVSRLTDVRGAGTVQVPKIALKMKRGFLNAGRCLWVHPDHLLSTAKSSSRVITNEGPR